MAIPLGLLAVAVVTGERLLCFRRTWASLSGRRISLEERLKAVIDLEHHQQHADDITTAIYSGRPLPTEGQVLTAYGQPGMTGRARTLPIRALSASGSLEGIVLDSIRNLDAQGVRVR